MSRSRLFRSWRRRQNSQYARYSGVSAPTQDCGARGHRNGGGAGPWSPGAFASFAERYPSVELTVTTPTDQVSLVRREADVALRMSLTLRRCVQAGVGAHLLPCFTAERDPTLHRIGPVDPAHVRDLWLLTLPELRTNVRVGAFMDHMEEALRSLAGELEGAGP